jgi:hypothetical protein
MSSGAQSYLAIYQADKNDPKSLPPTSATGEKINFISETLNAAPKTKQSKHVRSDRMVTGLSVVSLDVNGGFSNELHYAADAKDLLMQAAVWGKWQDLSTSTPGDVDVEDGTVVHSTGVLDLTGVSTPPNNTVQVYASSCLIRPTLALTMVYTC